MTARRHARRAASPRDRRVAVTRHACRSTWSRTRRARNGPTTSTCGSICIAIRSSSPSTSPRCAGGGDCGVVGRQAPEWWCACVHGRCVWCASRTLRALECVVLCRAVWSELCLRARGRVQRHVRRPPPPPPPLPLPRFAPPRARVQVPCGCLACVYLVAMDDPKQSGSSYCDMVRRRRPHTKATR